MSISIVLAMAGGLGLFLFGMEQMSDSIEKVAGAKLRRILEIFTTNRFMGMIVGIIFTGIVQSSSCLLYTSGAEGFSGGDPRRDQGSQNQPSHQRGCCGGGSRP